MRLPTYADFIRIRNRYLIDLAAVMHVRPWETDDLAFADLACLADAIDQMRREAVRG